MSTYAILACAASIAADPPYDGLVEKYSQAYGVSGEVVMAVLWVESRARAESVSRASAVGLMQLKFATARVVLPLRVKSMSDLLDPDVNINAGVAYLRGLLNRSATLGVAGWDYTLAAYNAGAGAIERARARTGRLPACAQRYVAAVDEQLWVQFGKRLAEVPVAPKPSVVQVKKGNRP